jgi:lipid-binding SYLF domain-containing protein
MKGNERFYRKKIGHRSQANRLSARKLFAGELTYQRVAMPNPSANQHVYGRDVSAKNIIRGGKVAVPAAGRQLVSLLNQKSPKNLSDPKSVK